MATSIDAHPRWPDGLPRVAVITGASRGLGAGIATRLGELGVALGLCARTKPVLPSGVPGVAASVDVADPQAIDAFAARVTDEVGPIGLWVANAGVLEPIGPVRDLPVEATRRHVEINVLGVLWGARTFARRVHDRDAPGMLVTISSGAATSVYPGWGPYGAAKAAVDQLSRVLAAEEADHGLGVVALAPGVVDTDMQATIRATPAERFPSVDRFHGLKAADAFNDPAWVADRIVELCDRANPPAWADGSDGVVLRVPDQPR